MIIERDNERERGGGERERGRERGRERQRDRETERMIDTDIDGCIYRYRYADT